MHNEVTKKSVDKLFGFLVLDKPSGLTSHDCVQRIRKILGIKRVGHGGTLDPRVTGVLPIAIGNATRLLPYLKGSKTYIGLIQLGLKTSTDDLSGEVICKKKVPELSLIKLEAHLNKFRGRIKQIPPQVSSVNIDGERAYKRHRRGEQVTIPYRTVEIHSLEILNWDESLSSIEISIDCSSGTYIRSIARDLGERIGCGGCLANLRRVQALGFREEQAIKLSKCSENKTDCVSSIINPIKALTHLPTINLFEEEEINYWRTGREISFQENRLQDIYLKCKYLETPQKDLTSVNVISKNQLIGIGTWHVNSKLTPKVVFNPKG